MAAKHHKTQFVDRYEGLALNPSVVRRHNKTKDDILRENNNYDRDQFRGGGNPGIASTVSIQSEHCSLPHKPDPTAHLPAHPPPKPFTPPTPPLVSRDGHAYPPFRRPLPLLFPPSPRVRPRLPPRTYARAPRAPRPVSRADPRPPRTVLCPLPSSAAAASSRPRPRRRAKKKWFARSVCGCVRLCPLG